MSVILKTWNIIVFLMEYMHIYENQIILLHPGNSLQGLVTVGDGWLLCFLKSLMLSFCSWSISTLPS